MKTKTKHTHFNKKKKTKFINKQKKKHDKKILIYIKLSIKS